MVQWFQMANSTYQQGLATGGPRRIVGASGTAADGAQVGLLIFLGGALLYALARK